MNTPIMQAIEDFKNSKATWDGADIAKVLADYLLAEEALMKEVWEAGMKSERNGDSDFAPGFNQFISQYNKK